MDFDYHYSIIKQYGKLWCMVHTPEKGFVAQVWSIDTILYVVFIRPQAIFSHECLSEFELKEKAEYICQLLNALTKFRRVV